MRTVQCECARCLAQLSSLPAFPRMWAVNSFQNTRNMGESATREWSRNLRRQLWPELGTGKKKGEEEKERYVCSLGLLNLTETRNSAKGSFSPRGHITGQPLVGPQPACVGTHCALVSVACFRDLVGGGCFTPCSTEPGAGPGAVCCSINSRRSERPNTRKEETIRMKGSKKELGSKGSF